MVEVIAQAVSKQWEDVPLGGAANGAQIDVRTFAAKGRYCRGPLCALSIGIKDG